MFQTEYGAFNGDSWEQLCKRCLKMKFTNEGYQDMPADVGGDLGIEGFVLRNGTVFQCYCPDINLGHIDLYEKQRNKITTDIGKLIANQSELPKYIGKDLKIKQWVFLTPSYTNKDLNQHARNKEAEVLKKKCGCVDPEFKIVIWTIQNIEIELGLIRNASNNKDIFPSSIEDIDLHIANWTEENISLTNNANKKNGFLLQELNKLNEGSVNILTTNTTTDFLDYSSVLLTWQRESPEEYEKYMTIIRKYEKGLPARKIIATGLMKDMVSELKAELKESFNGTFPNLSHETTKYLIDGTIADWILRCPLNFE